MSSLAIALTMFACVLVSNLVAMMVAERLPGHHLSSDSRDVVKLGLGVVGTLTALVLGLLVSATKATFDTQTGTIKELAAQIGVIDRLLARYGPDADAARKQLPLLTQSVLDQLWPVGDRVHIDFSGGSSKREGETLYELVSSLEPTNDAQRSLKSRVEDIVIELGRLRQRLVVNAERSIPMPLLVVLGAWQAVLFAGFGLLTPRNLTTVTSLIICMLSVAGAIFLIMELERPFAGIVRVPNASLRSVLSNLGK
jgi:hypothetical protein